MWQHRRGAGRDHRLPQLRPPEDPEVMWQFSEAILGLVDGCKALGTPVTGGNVSFYNQTGGANIMPTPVIGVLGIIEDVADRIRSGFTTPGDNVFLVGETHEDMSGTAWADDHPRPHRRGAPDARLRPRAAAWPHAGRSIQGPPAQLRPRPGGRRPCPGLRRVLPAQRPVGVGDTLPSGDPASSCSRRRPDGCWCRCRTQRWTPSRSCVRSTTCR